MGGDNCALGCSISVAEDGRSARGWIGSVALDVDEDATIIGPPGIYAPCTILCDCCYLQGVWRKHFKEPANDGGRAQALAIGLFPPRDDIWVLYYAPHDWIGVLCAFEERWLFYAVYNYTPDSTPSFSWQCIGYAEESDVRPDVHPDATELRDFIEAHLLSVNGI